MSDAYQTNIAERLRVIRERVIDIVAVAAPSNDSETIRAMNDIAKILNELEYRIDAREGTT